MNSAFHQFELFPESRSITTFQCDSRLKRYCRLNFGVNSTQEKIQHALREVLSGIKGVLNMADNILIYAPTISEHDAILETVFSRLRQRGL